MKQKSIAIIKNLIDTGDIEEDLLQSLKHDGRKGVKKLLKSYEYKLEKQRKLEKKFIEMSSYEHKIYDRGLKYVAGIDEAGRGPLAGPVVAAAVILPKDIQILGLTDSKQLSEKKRYEFYQRIKDEAICYSIAIIDNQEIDEINILEATKKAMRLSLSKLTTNPDHVLIDAVNIHPLPYSSDVIVKGDQKSITIAAASILAKVTRDHLMEKIHHHYPIYHFNDNKGYGTQHHVRMLKKHGITPYHRRSFSPVQKVLK